MIDVEQQLQEFRGYLENSLEMITGARDATPIIYVALGVLCGLLLLHLMRRGLRRTFNYENAPRTTYSKVEDAIIMVVSVVVTLICTLAVIGFTYN